MPDVAFNETVAATYDADSASMFDPALLTPTVDFLADVAAGGPALEFGIGTGRVALPLSERGIWVSGIDISEPMLARLRAKPGAERIGLTIGDITGTRVAGQFSLVYMVFNVITNLLTQDEQVACFQNAAAHLSPGGAVVAEVWIPELQRLTPGARFVPFEVTPQHLGFDEYELAEQRCTSHHYFMREDGRTQVFDSRHRYAWPSELDLMARLAGLTLAERWSDWRRSPFTSESRNHVAVWRRA